MSMPRYHCMACPVAFPDALSANRHHDLTGHHQTHRPEHAYAATRLSSPAPEPPSADSEHVAGVISMLRGQGEREVADLFDRLLAERDALAAIDKVPDLYRTGLLAVGQELIARQQRFDALAADAKRFLEALALLGISRGSVDGVEKWWWNDRDGNEPICDTAEQAANATWREYRALARIAADAKRRDDRQRAILAWTAETFGAARLNVPERAARFVEEAVELGQACGLSSQFVATLIARVYGNPPSAPEKEIGQVGLTLLALAERLGLSADGAEEAEWQRVRSLPREHWEKRHQAKAASGILLDDDAAMRRADATKAAE